MARAGYVRDRNPHRIDRRAGLLPMAGARRALCQSALASTDELFMYARKVKETANGSWRCPLGKTWQTFQVIAKRSFAKHVQVNEQNEAPQNG